MLNLELYVSVKLMYNMVEGGMEMNEPVDEILDEYSDESLKPDDDVEENISEVDSENIHQQQETLSQFTGDARVSQRERLKRDKVDEAVSGSGRLFQIALRVRPEAVKVRARAIGQPLSHWLFSSRSFVDPHRTRCI